MGQEPEHTFPLVIPNARRLSEITYMILTYYPVDKLPPARMEFVFVNDLSKTGTPQYRVVYNPRHPSGGLDIFVVQAKYPDKNVVNDISAVANVEATSFLVSLNSDQNYSHPAKLNRLLEIAMRKSREVLGVQDENF